MATDSAADPMPGHEDLENLLAKIADQLSVLSECEQTPTGFDAPYDPFEADEVDFDAGAWLLRLLQVQAWLFPDEDVKASDAEKDPGAAVAALLKAIGADRPNDGVRVDNGVAHLSLPGAEHLSSRLDSALRLQEQFVELLEEQSRQQASERWLELWDEETPRELSPDPIRATAQVWPIQEYTDKAVKGRLNLAPSYQRGDVWPTSDAQKLIESILRGIPLPSIIVLSPHGEGATAKFEVVDGKQRLTSILRFVGKHPRALEHVKEADVAHPQVGFKELFETNYRKFRKQWKIHIGVSLGAAKEAEYYFPFPLPKSGAFVGLLEPLAGKYYYEIKENHVQVGTDTETVEDLFCTVSEYKIPTIKYTDATARQVHEVFHLYNKQGKHLNAEEIRNAEYHDLELMKLLLATAGDHPAIEELAGFLPEAERWRMKEIAENLTDYRFGVTRYKRTKMLSWVTSLVMQPALQDDGSLSVRSTAKHIDDMLIRLRADVKSQRSNALADHIGLCNLITDLHETIDAHSSTNAWDDKFKDEKDGSKWLELQLAASLTGVFLVSIATGDATVALERERNRLRDFTFRHRRPEKAQNKTQWEFIGKIALGIADICGVDRAQLVERLEARYGHNGVATLCAAAAQYKQRSRSNDA